MRLGNGEAAFRERDVSEPWLLSKVSWNIAVSEICTEIGGQVLQRSSKIREWR